MSSSKRSIKLIQPRFQLKLIGTFVGLSGLALLLQFLLFTSSLSEVAAELPQDGSRLMAEIPGLVWHVFFVSFGLFLPLSVLVGISITFRWAGPLYRFKVHLGRIAAGERPGECRIRRGDELQDLCRVINAAV
ncbi:MAG: hypothetical protein AAF368_17010, partial [Planctomycetota bacterium]